MSKTPTMNAMRTEERRRAPGVVIDWVTGISVGVASTGLFALLGGGLRLETLLRAAACTGVIILVALWHGGVGSIVSRLREKPNDLPSR